jgi:hypothetical protein
MNSVIRTMRGFIRQQQSLQVVSLLQQACPLPGRPRYRTTQQCQLVTARRDQAMRQDSFALWLPRQRRIVWFEPAELRHLQSLRTGQEGPALVSTKGSANVRLKSRGMKGLSPGLRDDLRGGRPNLFQATYRAYAEMSFRGSAPWRGGNGAFARHDIHSAMLFRGHEGRKQVCQQKGRVWP